VQGKLVKTAYEKEHHKAVQNYMDYLAVARSKFEAALEALKARNLTPEIRMAAVGMAHKISGNALMYGYQDLGDRARELENFLSSDQNQNMAMGQSLCLKILQKIDEIQAQVSMPEKAEFEAESFQHDPTPDRWKTVSIKTGGLGSNGQKPSVLLVHSDPAMLETFQTLMSADYEVIAIGSAHQAMAIAVNNNPDLVITEQSLKDMTGIDMTRFIRNVEGLSQTPVIMIMSSDDPDEIVAAVQAGVTDCFEKNREIEPILNHAKELLKKSQHHVLIVDDDKAVRDLLKSRFEAYGIRVDTANDGIEGLEYLRNQKPDLIVLDRMMPRLEGGAVLYQIQQEISLKSIPVMLVTAMTNKDDAITWLERGATDYITKPFNPDEIVLRAIRHLRVEKNAA